MNTFSTRKEVIQHRKWTQRNHKRNNTFSLKFNLLCSSLERGRHPSWTSCSAANRKPVLAIRLTCSSCILWAQSQSKCLYHWLRTRLKVDSELGGNLKLLILSAATTVATVQHALSQMHNQNIFAWELTSSQSWQRIGAIFNSSCSQMFKFLNLYF